MNIIIHRIRHRPDTIDGILKIDGLKVCDCAENAHHCLPPGNYPIILARSRKYARKMPWIITDQSSFIAYRESQLMPSLITNRESLIESSHSSLIMPGNGVYNLIDGSIIVGKHLIPGIVSHSRPAFDTLYQRIRKTIERGHSVTLTII